MGNTNRLRTILGKLEALDKLVDESEKQLTKIMDELAKDEPYDLESSGEYLIGEVTHQYDPTMGSNGRFLTTLRLMRDSYGMKGKASVHST